MAAAAVSETHCATVFFTGDRAYKLKKPVNLGFLDFSTQQLGERACHEEVCLNRRFAPDVYSASPTCSALPAPSATTWS